MTAELLQSDEGIVPRFTLRQLECFRAAADHGSFQGAAAELFLSPTAVANAVRQLEAELGTQLCVPRRSQGVTVTPAGSAVLARARRLLKDAEELSASGGDDGGLRGALAVGCYATLAPTLLPRLLAAFAARHPHVEVSFVDATMDELLPGLSHGLLDVVLTYRIGLPPGLAEVTLQHTAVQVLLPAAHRLAAQTTVSLRDLADEPLVMLDVPPSGRHTLDMLQKAGVSAHVAHRTTNFELVRSLVARGQGYSLLVQRPRNNDVSYEGLPLVSRPISPEPADESIVAIWPQDHRLTPRSAALIDLAKELLSSE